MDEKRVYLLAELDEEANRRLADIYQQLAQTGMTGTQTPAIPYHFTMASFDLDQEDRVLDLAQAVCRQTRAFDMCLSHIGLFGLRVLFIAPAMNHELLALHDALDPDAPAAGAHQWVAHATVLIDEPECIQAAIPFVAQSFQPFTARIERITAYEFFPSRFLGTYELQS